MCGKVGERCEKVAQSEMNFRGDGPSGGNDSVDGEIGFGLQGVSATNPLSPGTGEGGVGGGEPPRFARRLRQLARARHCCASRAIRFHFNLIRPTVTQYNGDHFEIRSRYFSRKYPRGFSRDDVPPLGWKSTGPRPTPGWMHAASLGRQTALKHVKTRFSAPGGERSQNS